MTNFVSVLIPTYNRIHTLMRAVDSVLKQTHENLECIVIDDHSSDETIELLKKVEDPRLIVIENSGNLGVSAARNIGFEKSCGSAIALLDSDDEWLEDRLEKQLPLLNKYPLVHGEEIWVRNGKRVNPKKIHKKSGGDIFERAVELCLISPSATIMRRELYLEMEGFREDFPVCEDYELWLRITSKYHVGFIEDPVIIKYGGHDDQLSRKFKAMDYWRVKAMRELYINHELSSIQKGALKEALIRKSTILRAGYIKHQGDQEQLKYITECLEMFNEV